MNSLLAAVLTSRDTIWAHLETHPCCTVKWSFSPSEHTQNWPHNNSTVAEVTVCECLRVCVSKKKKRDASRTKRQTDFPMSTESSRGSIQADNSLTDTFCCEASSASFNSSPRSSDFASDQRCCSDIFEKGEEKKHKLLYERPPRQRRD